MMNMLREGESLGSEGTTSGIRKMEPQTRTQRLRYPTVEQVRAVPAPGSSSISNFTSLLPTEEGEPKDAEALRKIAELEGQISQLERQVGLTAERCRLEGEEAGRNQANESFTQALAESRKAIGAALEAFDVERQSYFRRVEAEVVKLALAIAKKVLHRETQMDPLLLAGAVRSALDRLEQSGGAVLRVASADGSGWQRALEGTSERTRPKVIEDPQLNSGGCVLETQMGTVELSVDIQLKEIERGFFDLLERQVP
jgi:flagellar assembly protein FliH